MTQEDLQYIFDNYKSMTYKELGDAIGLTPSTVNYYINKYGLRGKTRLQISEDDAEYIRENYLLLPYQEIADKIGIEERQLRGWIYNHIKDRKLKTRQFNDTYFHEIVTPNQAYWLGFIYADGWIVFNTIKRNYEFGMQLQLGDKYILEALNEQLGGVHKIHVSHKDIRICSNSHASQTDSAVLRVYSKQLVSDLYEHGIDVRKSHSDKYPIVPDKLFPDYLRGFIDGDGCIHKIKDDILGVHITGANQKCFQYIQQKLSDMYNISSKIYSEEIPNYSTKYRLYCFRQDDVRRLLDIIYYDENAIKLKRKYNVYQNFYGLVA